jgi:hypothetical protein
MFVVLINELASMFKKDYFEVIYNEILKGVERMIGRFHYKSGMIRYSVMLTRISCATILMVAMLLAGCSHNKASEQIEPHQKYMEEMKSTVNKEIPDPARAEKILALMNKLSNQFMAQKMQLGTTQQEIIKLNTDYDTTPEQMQKAMDESLASRMENRKKIMNTYFELKSLMNKKEWEAISKADAQAMAEFLKSSEKFVK